MKSPHYTYHFLHVFIAICAPFWYSRHAKECIQKAVFSEKLVQLHTAGQISLQCIVSTQDIGDVSGDHEIGMVNWHHGRLATHDD